MRKLPVIPPLTTKISVLKDIFMLNIGLGTEKINNKHILSKYCMFKDSKRYETHTAEQDKGDRKCQMKERAVVLNKVVMAGFI